FATLQEHVLSYNPQQTCNWAETALSNARRDIMLVLFCSLPQLSHCLDYSYSKSAQDGFYKSFEYEAVLANNANAIWNKMITSISCPQAQQSSLQETWDQLVTKCKEDMTQ